MPAKLVSSVERVYHHKSKVLIFLFSIISGETLIYEWTVERVIEALETKVNYILKCKRTLSFL